MIFFVVLQFVLLIGASLMLLLEARKGDLERSDDSVPRVRATVYLLATIAGATMLIAIADGEWLFAIALIPITFLSLLRFSMLARRWWEGWRLPLFTCALIGLGIAGSLPLMPYPLDRAYILQKLHLVDEEVSPPDTIDPEAIAPVRV